jgi:hypothetical protein
VRVTTLYIKLWHVQVVLLTVDHRRVVKNGTCGTDSCNKLTVFDWLSNELTWTSAFDCVEVRFKNGRKVLSQYWKINAEYGDIVATVASPGHDIGIVTLTGELVKIQMKKQILTVTRFLKSTEKHHRKTLTSGLLHGKKSQWKFVHVN